MSGDNPFAIDTMAGTFTVVEFRAFYDTLTRLKVHGKFNSILARVASQ